MVNLEGFVEFDSGAQIADSMQSSRRPAVMGLLRKLAIDDFMPPKSGNLPPLPPDDGDALAKLPDVPRTPSDGHGLVLAGWGERLLQNVG